MEYFLGFSTGQIELTKKMIAAGISEEQKALAKEIDEMSPKPDPIPAGQLIPGKQPIPKPGVNRK
jgi:hypothetical protein